MELGDGITAVSLVAALSAAFFAWRAAVAGAATVRMSHLVHEHERWQQLASALTACSGATMRLNESALLAAGEQPHPTTAVALEAAAVHDLIAAQRRLADALTVMHELDPETEEALRRLAGRVRPRAAAEEYVVPHYANAQRELARLTAEMERLSARTQGWWRRRSRCA